MYRVAHPAHRRASPHGSQGKDTGEREAVARVRRGGVGQTGADGDEEKIKLRKEENKGRKKENKGEGNRRKRASP